MFGVVRPSTYCLPCWRLYHKNQCHRWWMKSVVSHYMMNLLFTKKRLQEREPKQRLNPWDRRFITHIATIPPWTWYQLSIPVSPCKASVKDMTLSLWFQAIELNASLSHMHQLCVLKILYVFRSGNNFKTVLILLH